jgi:RNA chaperone Hfq
MSDQQPANVSHLSGYSGAGLAHASTPRPTSHTNHTPGKKFTAKGHDKQLEDYQYNKLPVQINLISGSLITGAVARRDKYTITIRDKHGVDEIVYKHAIESIRPLTVA